MGLNWTVCFGDERLAPTLPPLQVAGLRSVHITRNDSAFLNSSALEVTFSLL